MHKQADNFPCGLVLPVLTLCLKGQSFQIEQAPLVLCCALLGSDPAPEVKTTQIGSLPPTPFNLRITSAAVFPPHPLLGTKIRAVQTVSHCNTVNHNKIPQRMKHTSKKVNE